MSFCVLALAKVCTAFLKLLTFFFFILVFCFVFFFFIMSQVRFSCYIFLESDTIWFAKPLLVQITWVSSFLFELGSFIPQKVKGFITITLKGVHRPKHLIGQHLESHWELHEQQRQQREIWRSEWNWGKPTWPRKCSPVINSQGPIGKHRVFFSWGTCNTELLVFIYGQ